MRYKKNGVPLSVDTSYGISLPVFARLPTPDETSLGSGHDLLAFGRIDATDASAEPDADEYEDADGPVTDEVGFISEQDDGEAVHPSPQPVLYRKAPAPSPRYARIEEGGALPAERRASPPSCVLLSPIRCFNDGCELRPRSRSLNTSSPGSPKRLVKMSRRGLRLMSPRTVARRGAALPSIASHGHAASVPASPPSVLVQHRACFAPTATGGLGQPLMHTRLGGALGEPSGFPASSSAMAADDVGQRAGVSAIGAIRRARVADGVIGAAGDLRGAAVGWSDIHVGSGSSGSGSYHGASNGGCRGGECISSSGSDGLEDEGTSHGRARRQPTPFARAPPPPSELFSPFHPHGFGRGGGGRAAHQDVHTPAATAEPSRAPSREDMGESCEPSEPLPLRPLSTRAASGGSKLASPRQYSSFIVAPVAGGARAGAGTRLQRLGSGPLPVLPVLPAVVPAAPAPTRAPSSPELVSEAPARGKPAQLLPLPLPLSPHQPQPDKLPSLPPAITKAGGAKPKDSRARRRSKSADGGRPSEPTWLRVRADGGAGAGAGSVRIGAAAAAAAAAMITAHHQPRQHHQRARSGARAPLPVAKGARLPSPFNERRAPSFASGSTPSAPAQPQPRTLSHLASAAPTRSQSRAHSPIRPRALTLNAKPAHAHAHGGGDIATAAAHPEEANAAEVAEVQPVQKPVRILAPATAARLAAASAAHSSHAAAASAGQPPPPQPAESKGSRVAQTTATTTKAAAIKTRDAGAAGGGAAMAAAKAADGAIAALAQDAFAVGLSLRLGHNGASAFSGAASAQEGWADLSALVRRCAAAASELRTMAARLGSTPGAAYWLLQRSSAVLPRAAELGMGAAAAAPGAACAAAAAPAADANSADGAQRAGASREQGRMSGMHAGAAGAARLIGIGSPRAQPRTGRPLPWARSSAAADALFSPTLVKRSPTQAPNLALANVATVGVRGMQHLHARQRGEKGGAAIGRQPSSDSAAAERMAALLAAALDMPLDDGLGAGARARLEEAASRCRERVEAIRRSVRLKLEDEADVELALHAVAEAEVFTERVREEGRRRKVRSVDVFADVLAELAGGDSRADAHMRSSGSVKRRSE